ncbi:MULTISPECIES: hypothetical protein [unclassified Nocardioides]|uniref:hypothetical protein n=1 Tax=unclassified Nocardioides TaxID=2615069 RepID=UPI0009F13433|nr:MULTISPECIES: hypothetical protein [unclassified Nocardioides]GAW51263.1 uncharacterized protein PD653B2_3604 [Nocardioides sp. PD653-B2]GAW52610.1 uncharacterized protein PD653_0002 [Nocardioides sp. PD653]
MLRDTRTSIGLAAVTGLLASILVLGALGLIILNWEWSGLCAGVAGLLVSVIAYRRTRRVGFFAPVGLFASLALVEAWLLWTLRGDSEAIDPLVFLGLGASLGGLFIGGLVLDFLVDPDRPDETT